MPTPVTIPPAVDHVVQFYDDDAVLIATLADYVGTGLATGQACLVIATQDHRDALEERLRATGPDLAAARAAGQYVAADAEDTLARIEVSGDVDPQRFAEAVGALFGRLRSERPLRVFGEMVGLLLAPGAPTRRSASRNSGTPCAPLAFELLCAYPLASLGGRALAHPIVEICARHSRVIPAGSARPLDEAARLRAIVALQQQASALQAEVVESNAAETALRVVKEELEVQVEDLRRLHEMAVRLTGNLDVESVLREVLEAAIAVPHTRRGLLSLCAPERPGLTLAVHAGFDQSFLRRGAPRPAGRRGLRYRLPRAAPGGGRGRGRRPGLRGLPWRGGARRLPVVPQHAALHAARRHPSGSCRCSFRSPRRPADRELRLMDLHARIAADAIENARLHQRLQEELEDRKQSLARERTARAEAETRQPREGRVPRDRLARAAHAAQRDPRLGRASCASGTLATRPPCRAAPRSSSATRGRRSQLIEDILDVSRIITGKLYGSPAPVDLAAGRSTPRRTRSGSARGQGHRPRAGLDPAARQLSGDAASTPAAVWNLLSNAIKFTPAGGRVEIRLARTDGHAEIRVSDTGEGIAPTSCPTSSIASARPTRPSRVATAGSAWALAIVPPPRRAARGHRAGRERGRGSARRSPSASPLGPARSRTAAGSRPGRTAAPPGEVQLLLVDDDPAHLDMPSLLLCEAEARAPTRRGALALLPLIRPTSSVGPATRRATATSLIRSLRTLERHRAAGGPRRSRFTAYVRVQDRARAVDAGFDVFVEKPVDPDELVSVIGGLVDSRAQRRGARPRRPPVLTGRPATFPRGLAQRSGGLARLHVAHLGPRPCSSRSRLQARAMRGKISPSSCWMCRASASWVWRTVASQLGSLGRSRARRAGMGRRRVAAR